jgi:hypothetical protein
MTKTKNKKLMLAAAVIVFIFGIFGFVEADENAVTVIPSPKIHIDKLIVDPVEESAQNITGSFDIFSQEDKNYHDIYYEIDLYQVAQESLSVEPEKIYNPSNWQLVASFPSPQSLFIASQGREQIDYSIAIPQNISIGNFLIAVNVFQGGNQTGLAVSQPFDLEGNGVFVQIQKKAVVKGDERYEPNLGIDFSQEETPIIAMILHNVSGQEIDAYEKVVIFNQSQFGEEVFGFEDENSITLSGGEKKDYLIELPPFPRAGSFLAKLQLYDKKGGAPVSGPQYFRFVVQGEGGRIIELDVPEVSYKKGEQVSVNVIFVGSADSVLLNEENIWTENPERQNVSANLEVFILDKNSGLIIGAKSSPVILSSNQQNMTVLVSLGKNINGYIVRAVLSKDSSIFDEKEITIESTASQKEQQGFLLALFAVLLLIILAAGYYWRKRKISEAALLFVLFLLALSFLLSSPADAYTVIENWSSPYDGQRYNTVSNSGDVVYFSATPEVTGCSNQIRNVGATGFYVNGEQVSEGLGGYGAPTVNLPYARLGANTAELKLEIDLASVLYPSVIYSSSRTFYIDTAKIYVGVYYQTDRGLSPIPGASVACGSNSGTTDSRGAIEFFSVPPGSITCTANATGFNGNSIMFTVDQVSHMKSITLTPAAPLPPVPSPSAPTCSISFNPSSLPSTGGPANWTVNYSNDADGDVPYSCTGNIGSGTLTGGPAGSGSYSGATNVTNVPQTCALTVANSANQTATCSATITLSGATDNSGYYCGLGYNCQPCSNYPNSPCVFSTLSACQSSCQPPPLPSCSCELRPSEINQGSATTLYWKESGDSDGTLSFSMSGGYLRWEYINPTRIAGHLSPRCECDNSTTAQDCPARFAASISDPEVCYDQTIIRGSYYSYRYTKTKIASGTLEPDTVYGYGRNADISSDDRFYDFYNRYPFCSCDASPATADCPESFEAGHEEMALYCTDRYEGGLWVYRKYMAWNGKQDFIPIPDSPVTFSITARNEGGNTTSSCTVNVIPAVLPPDCYCSNHEDYCPWEKWEDSCGNPVCEGGTKDCDPDKRYKEVTP